jgi:Mg2+ and Co2+ transporter CorA
MLKAFLYNANGHDQEINIEKKLPKLTSTNLLWIDKLGRDDQDLTKLAKSLRLNRRSLFDLHSPSRNFFLRNYGDYYQFDLSTLLLPQNLERKSIGVPRTVKLDCLIGKNWLLTVHDEPIEFLEEFRKQYRGETLIGNLSAASFAAALLDWHLGTFLAATETLEAFVDRLDVRMLAHKSVRESLLVELVNGRRIVSLLRRVLAPQRTIFYGLSRPDFATFASNEASIHFKDLERRFERVLDTIGHGRELVQGSFELFATRIDETTNLLIRRLTFLSLALGVVGAVAGIFGMNFQTPYTETGTFGFWMVVLSLAVLVVTAGVTSWYRNWI